MPQLDEYLRTLERSRLVSRDLLMALRAKLPASERDDPVALSKELVERKHLTLFQAAKILAGRSGPFILGRWVIVNQLGAGGMGKVYLARDRETRRKVAIKVLPPKKARETEALLARFLREADLSRRVQHPNVAATIDVGQQDDVHYIVMEYIPGQTLWAMVQKGGPLRVPDAARLFGGVAAGLAHVHAIGLVHRDVKPANIMVTPDGSAKLLDLGLARDVEDDQSGLTRDGTVIGTMDYVSPEQAADSKQVDARGDIYSLGCSLYFALAGHPPFGAETIVEKLYKHCMEDPPPLEHVARGVPAEFGAVVRKMMAKNPADRHQSAEELSTELARWTDPARVKQLLGAAADSGQLFRPPPPELQDTELQLGDTKLRALGNDEPSDAPVPRRQASTPRAVQPRKPLERIRPQPGAASPRESQMSNWLLVAALVVVGLLMLLGVILVSQM